MRRAWLLAVALVLLAGPGRVDTGESIRYRPPTGLVGGPPLKRTVVALPQATVATLNSVPVVLVPAVAGKVIFPEKLHVYREPGTAWDTTGAWAVSISWQATMGTLNAFSTNAPVVLLGADAQTWIETRIASPAEAVLAPGGYSIVNNPIVLRLESTSNPTGGTGGLVVTIWYREWGITQPQ